MLSRSIYVAFEAFPRIKGASVHMASMLKALATDFGPVCCLCLGFGDMPSFQHEGDIEIRRFKEYHPNMLKRAQGFAEFVAQNVADMGSSARLAVFRDPWGGAPLVSEALCPTIFEVNALPSWELSYTYPAFTRNMALMTKIRDMELFCLTHSDAVLPISDVTRSALQRLGVPAGRMTVVGNSATAPFFSAGNGSKQRPDLPPGRWIGYFGSLHPWQGADLLIDAFAMACDRIPDVNLLAVCGGKKERRKAFRKRIRKRGLSERVTLMPPMQHEALAPFVAAMEYSLAPLDDTPRNTHQGCCPLKIVESMAAGTPVIASDLRVVRELVTDGVDGLLVRPNSKRALAVAMAQALKDQGRQKQLSQAARKSANERFTSATVSCSLRQVFSNVASLNAGNKEE